VNWEISGKSVFVAENPHFIESNDHESWLIINRKYSGCTVTNFWNFCAVGSSRKFKRSSVASQTGLPGKGGGLVRPVYWERMVKRPRKNFFTIGPVVLAPDTQTCATELKKVDYRPITPIGT
jgi:hypothetical protein